MPFQKSPAEFFYRPGIDEGVSFLEKPDWHWREIDRHPVTTISAVADDDVATALKKRLDQQIRAHKQKVMLTNSHMVHMKDVTFRDSYIFVGGRGFLAGTAGSRLRSVYHLSGKTRRAEFEAVVRGADLEADKPAFPVLSEEVDKDLPISIACRNYANYYHFMAETFSTLCAISMRGEKRRVRVHAPWGKVTGFVRNFTEAFLAERFDSVSFLFDQSGFHYENTLGSYTSTHLIYQMPEREWQGLHNLPESAQRFRRGDMGAANTMSNAAIQQRLFSMREHCLSVVADKASPVGRKLYIGRRDSWIRGAREMEREADLRRELFANGFEEIFFEDLSPHDQVLAMRDSDVVVAAHGAGLTNMAFASPSTRVVEIGNLSSVIGRWNAFVRIAQISKCDFRTVFADPLVPTGRDVPTMELLPAALTNRSIDAIMENALGA